MPFAALRTDLDRLASRGRQRSLSPRRGFDFSSNDYLALAASARLGAAVTAALAAGMMIGSGGSRLLRGNDPEHIELEADAARFFGSDSALFFASGYAANMALLATLPQHGDLVVHDTLVHASMHDGMRLGRAQSVAAGHNDADAINVAIADWRRRGGRGTAWIAVESLYSMDGDYAPLADLAQVAARHDAVLIVDEAHATGVWGAGGRGLAAPLADRPDLITLNTLGKALGCEGALVCAPGVVRDFLIARARSFIFSTAPSPLLAAAARESLAIVADEPERRDRLHALIAFAHERFAPLGAVAGGSQIVVLPIGDDHRAVRIAAAVQEAGFDVRAIRPPTVPEGTARLRISVTLHVDEAAIAALTDRLETLL